MSKQQGGRCPLSCEGAQEGKGTLWEAGFGLSTGPINQAYRGTMQAGEAAWGPATQGHARDLVHPKGHRRFSAGEQQDEIKCVRKHQLLGRQWTEEREELAARTHGKTEKMRWNWQKEGGNDALETNSRGASTYYG